ncbi:MAG: hypothetical protein LQ352_003615 [Teloschistes flavicans]|nr:MAG: hypothetical protein LQ352_003615 [Teloschistes flavicans]
MPEDEDVLKDFGFNNVLFGGDQSQLLGVNGGLYRSGTVSAEEIHEWRIGGILVQKIKEFYLSMPEHSRGQYFAWFLKNSHTLERLKTRQEAEQDYPAVFYDKSKPYLETSDHNKAVRDLKPEAKKLSYYLLAGTLHRISPNPTDEAWYFFGFVTCRGMHEEAILQDLYQLVLTESDESFFYEFHSRRRGIVPPATFTQF